MKGALALVAVAAAAIAALVARPDGDDSARPNLLLVTVDTMRADRLGAYGWTRAATPAIDALARRGVLFESAFTISPVTLPAHASILTGRLPSRHGIRGNSFYTLRDGEVTLPQVLQAEGYRTGAVVAAAVLDRRFGLNRGFAVYDDEMPGLQTGALIAERDAASVVSRALAWLGDVPNSVPFFFWVHLFDPHHPYAPAEPVGSSFRDAPYDGEIAYADREIARLLSALESQGVLRNTLILLTSDHGESLGEHGEDTHGVFLYDSTLRVPLIVAGPGVPSNVRRSGAPVSLVDVLPTVLGRLNVAPPPDLDGIDLFASNLSRREFVYAETYLPRDFYNWSPLQALRSSGMKFVKAPSPELYDLRDDPSETDNRAQGREGLVAELTRSIDETQPGSNVSADESGLLTPDAEFARRLESLGYVSGAGPVRSRAPAFAGADPKTRIHLVRQMDRALALARSTQKDAAVALLQRVLTEDPNNYLAAHTLGDVLYDVGRDTDAVAAYETAMLDRNVAYYHYRLGLLYERQANYAAAAARFGQLVRRSPEATGEIVDRATGLRERGEAAAALSYVEALAAAMNAAPLSDEYRRARVEIQNALGAAHGDAGNLHEAAAAFAKAAALAPDHFDSQANLGFTRLREGDVDAALELFTRALALRPREVRVINVVAELRFRRHELAAARDLLARSLAIDAEQPRITKALRDVDRRLAAQ